MANAIEWKDVAGVIAWIDRGGIAWADREAVDSPVATVIGMEKTGPFPVAHEIFLYFKLEDASGDPVTGAVISEFSFTRVENGAEVAPHGLYMTEVGAGWYFLGTSSGNGYIADQELHVIINLEHTNSGADDQLHFFCLFMDHDRYLIV